MREQTVVSSRAAALARAGEKFRRRVRRHTLRRVLSYLLAVAGGGLAVAAVAWWHWPRQFIREHFPSLANTGAPVGEDPWTKQPDTTFPIPPYAAFLDDVRIVLDPGHIGQDERNRPKGWKRGPTGLREAEANLRVCLFLREFLQAAGARVILTREKDASLNISDREDLLDRADIANRFNADLLLSVHHNASPKPETNYTSIYYHQSPDHSPASLDAARHLFAGLNDALRLEQFIGSGLRSDYVEYPGDGFGVLRAARVPAVLCESSFHSNPAEERRLRDPLYNRREAYGLFIGLARWAQAGLPRVKLAPVNTPVPVELAKLPMLTPGAVVTHAPPKPAGRRGRSAPPPTVVAMQAPAPPLTDGAAGGAPAALGEAFVIPILLDDGLSKRPRTSGEVKIREDSIRVQVDGKPAAWCADLPKNLLYVQAPVGLRGRKFTLHVDFENVFGQHVLQPAIVVNGD